MRNRRKKQFVDRAVQGALARRIILHWLLFFTMAFFVFPLWKLLSSGDLSRPFAELMLRSWAETAPVLFVLVAMIPIFVWDTMTLSHRFAGPVYRFHKAIRDLAAGEEVPPIKLRKGDFWKNVAEDFNVMMERFKSEQAEQAQQDEEPEPAPCG